MSKTSQKQAFISYEADAWFDRNKQALLNYNPEKDKIIQLLREYKIKPKNILEIGSSAGYRLNAIHKIFSTEKTIGLEPSLEAISFGKKEYPNIEFLNSTADNMIELKNESFDVVIVGFVFYVIDREILLKSIAEIDRVLKNKGTLIIMDFYSQKVLKNNYHHINEFSAYTYKQNYDEIFTSSKLYHLLHKSSFNHISIESNIKDDFQEMVSVTLLKKDIHAGFE